MSKQQRLTLPMLTREPWLSQPSGLRLFSLLEDRAPGLVPRRWGPWEPPRESYADGGAERLVTHEEWGRHFLLWNGRERGVQASLTVRRFDFDILGALIVHGIPIPDDIEPLVRASTDLAVEFVAEFGALHVIGPADVQRGEAGGYVRVSDKGPEQLLVVPRTVTRYLPDLFWCTFLGPSYVQIFGRDALERVEAYEARFVSEDIFMVRFSEHPSWIVEHPADFEAQRQEVKEALRPGVFFSESSGADGDYLVPSFASVQQSPRAEPAPRTPEVSEGDQLIDPEGDTWVVKRLAGDQAALRRVKDDLPFDVGSLSKLLATGAFVRGATPSHDAAEKAKARQARRRARSGS